MERYGEEAEGNGRAAIAAAEHRYLSALATRNFQDACAVLAAQPIRSIREVAPPELRRRGCPAILPLFLAPSAPAVAREQMRGDIKLIRVRGDEAFIIFHAPGARLYVFNMLREAGRWKAAKIASSILAPFSTLAAHSSH